MATLSELFGSSLDIAIASIVVRIAQLEALELASASIDGESIDWTREKESLINRLNLLMEMRQTAGGPYEVTTRAIV